MTECLPFFPITVTLNFVTIGRRCFYRYEDAKTGKTGILPARDIDSFLGFPESMMDGQHLRSGAEVHLLYEPSRKMVVVDALYYQGLADGVEVAEGVK